MGGYSLASPAFSRFRSPHRVSAFFSVHADSKVGLPLTKPEMGISLI